MPNPRTGPTRVVWRQLAALLVLSSTLVPAQEPGGGAAPQRDLPTVEDEKPIWEQIWDSLALYGDFRFRHESSFELDDVPDRHRERVRLRLGANYQLFDEVLVGARVTTGSRDDPKSPHVTLGDGFDSFEVTIDRAFITYHPRWIPDGRLTGGKFDHPFYRNPVYGELVWDADVQPEGAFGGYSLSGAGPLRSVDLRAGGYVLLEQGDADDAFVSVFQGAGRFDLLEGLTGTLAVGYYLYTDATPDGSSAVLAENEGNATVDRDGDGNPDDFLSRFGCLNPIVSLTWSADDIPLTLSGEYIWNTEARTGGDEGWAVGIAAGNTRARGDWRAYYQWQVVQQDAVFSPVSQDDFLFSTNHRSHVLGVNYQLFDKVGLHVWALVSRRDRTFPVPEQDSAKHQWRVRFDINVRF